MYSGLVQQRYIVPIGSLSQRVSLSQHKSKLTSVRAEHTSKKHKLEDIKKRKA